MIIAVVGVTRSVTGPLVLQAIRTAENTVKISTGLNRTTMKYIIIIITAKSYANNTIRFQPD